MYDLQAHLEEWELFQVVRTSKEYLGNGSPLLKLAFNCRGVGTRLMEP
jgi:hypothetical protein